MFLPNCLACTAGKMIPKPLVYWLLLPQKILITFVAAPSQITAGGMMYHQPPLFRSVSAAHWIWLCKRHPQTTWVLVYMFCRWIWKPTTPIPVLICLLAWINQPAIPTTCVSKPMLQVCVWKALSSNLFAVTWLRVGRVAHWALKPSTKPGVVLLRCHLTPTTLMWNMKVIITQ